VKKAISKAVRRYVTRLLNPVQPFFQDRLFLTDAKGAAPSGYKETTARGLSDVLNPLNEIATEARQELLHVLKTLPGGSFGIAGPRGVGKSTLLSSLCASNPVVNGKE